jgi:nucleoside-diphosphate-sugar epimerase
MSKILITGAAGFIGSALARRMVHDGHDVYAFVRDKTKAWRLKDIAQDIHIVQSDLKDLSHLTLCISDINPQFIYHFATYGGYPYQEDVDNIINTNIMGTWNLLRASIGCDYKLFVNAGSSSEYGFKDHPMKETDMLEPNSYYSFAKCSQTLLCQYFSRIEKKPILNYRLFSVYGPNEEKSRLIPTVISHCLKNEVIDLVAPDTARDFVYIDDVIEACLCGTNSMSFDGQIINIGTGVQSTLLDVANYVIDIVNPINKNINYISPRRIWDTNKWVGDCSKAQSMIGWAAKVTLKEGLTKTIEWAKK